MRELPAVFNSTWLVSSSSAASASSACGDAGFADGMTENARQVLFQRLRWGYASGRLRPRCQGPLAMSGYRTAPAQPEWHIVSGAPGAGRFPDIGRFALCEAAVSLIPELWHNASGSLISSAALWADEGRSMSSYLLARLEIRAPPEPLRQTVRRRHRARHKARLKNHPAPLTRRYSQIRCLLLDL